MARSRAGETLQRGEGTTRRMKMRVGGECLEWETLSPYETMVLRTMVGRFNSDSDPRPYLVEGPPGRFRLYTGDAAGRARTERGIK